jgi:hypothetical protein
MMLKFRPNSIAYGAILFVFVLFVADFAEARGRGGGGRGGGGRGGGGRSFSRSGPASHGGFSSRARTQPSRQMNRPSQGGASRPSQGKEQANTRQGNRENSGKSQEDRQEWRDQSREDRQEAAKDRQEDRQDFIDDQHDDYWDDHHHYGYSGGIYVGTSTTYITTLPCTTTAVIVNGVTYYNCSSTWYQRGYSGSSVTYVTVKAPAGY